MTEHRPRRSFEIAVTDLGVNDIDEFLVNFRIVNAGHLAAHQFRRIDGDVACEDSPASLTQMRTASMGSLPANRSA